MAEKIIVRSVADLAIDAEDLMGHKVTEVYGRKPPEYGVYQTCDRVMILFADTDSAEGKEKSDDQRKRLARLNPARGEINGLVDGWRGPADEHAREDRTVPEWWHFQKRKALANRRKADHYDRRVGDALVVAFEGDVEAADALLANIKRDVLAERIASGRLDYLVAALAIVGLVLLATWLATKTFILCPVPGGKLALAPQPATFWYCAAAGAVGAFFSIALAIRGRTVLPDLQRTANTMDAALRVTVGFIGAPVLLGLMAAQLVTIKLLPSGPELLTVDSIGVLIVGFIAGFSERFVPDLLDKASAVAPSETIKFVSPPPPPPPPAPSAATPVGALSDEDPHPDQAGEDGCVCDHPLPEDMVVTDDKLPAAAGGVATRAANQGAGQ